MPSLDMNMNMNMAFAMPGSASGRLRPRYNSGVFAKRIKEGDPVVPPEMVRKEADDTNYPRFARNWDADLRSYTYLNDLLVHVPNCVNQLADIARANGTPAQDMTEAELKGEILSILNLALERENRFLEVIEQ